MIVRDAEGTLPSCLASAADLVDEIVVVDTGSEDRTREVAAAFGARVFSFGWVDDFAAARNESLRHARGDWIFSLDADDSLDEANRAKLRLLLQGLGEENVGYFMRSRSTLLKEARFRPVADQVRLFPNHPDHRWQNRIHEQIAPALRATGASFRPTDIVIEHSGYQDPALYRRKRERNLRLLRLEHGEHPRDPFTRLNLGHTLLEHGETSEALAILHELREEGIDAADCPVPLVFALEGSCLQRLGRPEEALTVCRAGRARFPDDPELLFQEVLLLRHQGDTQGAEGCLRQLLRGPGDVPPFGPGSAVTTGRAFRFRYCHDGLHGYLARHWLALTLADQERFAEAEAEWRAVLREEPTYAPALVELGELFLNQGRWADLDRAVKVLANDLALPVEAALLRARGHMARDELAEARQVLEKMIADHPEQTWPHVLLSQVLLRENDEAAEPVLREVLQRSPLQLESWCNLAKLLRNQGRPSETVEACAEARRHFPDHSDLLRIQGLALLERNDLAAAEACLARLIEVWGGAPPPGPEGREHFAAVRHGLALIYCEQDRLAEAEAQWKAVLAEVPEFVSASLGLAHLYLAQGQWPELGQVLRALEADPRAEQEVAVLRARDHEHPSCCFSETAAGGCADSGKEQPSGQ
jgi:tetratricopeptide (TPR) repeat protein